MLQPASRTKVGQSINVGVALLMALCVGTGWAQMLGDLAKPIEGRSMRAGSTHRVNAEGEFDPNGQPVGDKDKEDSNWDNKNLKPGETRVLLDEKGSGVITHIWFTFLAPHPQDWAPEGTATHQDVVLRMYWDDREQPAVETPLGDFFANAFGKRSEVISLPVVVEDADSYNCFWHMPFRKSARIEVENQHPDKPLALLYYNIDWIKKESIPADTPYFYARYRQEYPAQSGKDYVVLDTQGKGHVVGVVLSVRTRSPSWFGEGDEKIYIDGEKTASIWGTGTEDYFLSAFGLRATSTPYFGVPYFDQWGIIGGHTSAYRWHINDPIVFNTSVKVTFEHFSWISPDENPDYKSTSWNERQDDYSSVAFWYQTGKPTFHPELPSAEERKLPSLDVIIVPAKQFTDKKYFGEGAVTVQELKWLYPDSQLLYHPGFPHNAWVELPFTVDKKEPYRLLLLMTEAPDYGLYRAYLNGVPIGSEIDLYHEEVRTVEQHLLDFWPEPGEYTLKLECIGKNPKSSGYYCGIESLRLRERRPRVKIWAHEKDHDWRKEPKLYR
ncbi:MAG: DUF2961 domain-containing protein [Sedimentisphaerales bacterium]|nr:DUF2961 domain-containing protein [Sedimentisphaerales bacterium]